MSIIGVEFDRTRFDTSLACENYMRQSSDHDLRALLNLKNFHVKSSTCIFLSGERRKAFTWYDLWANKKFSLHRPDAYVIYIREVPEAGKWDAAEIPVPLPATQEKKQKLELARQKREFKRQETANRLKEKRRREKKDKFEKNMEMTALGKKAKRKKVKDWDDSHEPATAVKKSRKSLIIKAMTPHSPIFPDGDPPSIEAAVNSDIGEQGLNPENNVLNL